MHRSTFIFTVAACLTLGLPAMGAEANDAGATVSTPAPTPAGVPVGWGLKYSEYNIPKSIYVPGDPILLSDANKTSGRRINFVACPILRDSEPTPLWLAKYNGELYFLRAQQNFSGEVHHPQFLHQVLVEGVVSDEPRIGGGIVITPINISVMRELDPTCNQMLPSEGYSVAFAKRPPGPGSNGGDRESRNITRAAARARLDAATYTPDPVPHERREFLVKFDFESEIVWTYPKVGEAAKFARDVDAARIEIHGYRGSALLSDGSTVFEHEGIEKVRADKVRRILADYTLPRDRVSVDWQSAPAIADGVSDFSNRKVVIVVIPGPERHDKRAVSVAHTGQSAPR